MKIKWYKVVVGTLITLLAIFFLFALWYKNKYSMETAQTYEVNSPNLEKKLLLATQGSDFKNTVTQAIVDYYKSDSVFIKVIDISALNEVAPTDYRAILVMHTWEYEKPPAEVATFIERTLAHRDKIVVLTTSGPGTAKMEGVDAITGESKMDDAPHVVENIFNRLNPLLKVE